MRIDELQQNWDACGRLDPMWAILSVPGKANNRWDPQEFFATGLAEANDLFRDLDASGVRIRRGRALEFGCGVGRITQALCQYFEQCCGVDIAPSMIDLATSYNVFGTKCKYYLNHTDDLRVFPDTSFDFIYSRLVLQHMLPCYSKNYIAEFFRVLAPGGVAVFQVPSELRTPETSTRTLHPPLPPAAFKARIVPHPVPAAIAAGSWLEVGATVTNLSTSTWPSADVTPECPIRLGNHWLNKDSKVLVKDDGRVNVERDLKPMESIELALLVSTPSEPGDYILELDMVQEFVSWFADHNSEPARIPLSLQGGADREPQRKASPKIEMYGVPKPEVLDIIARAGGQVLQVREDAGAGGEWTGFLYIATKN